MKIKRKSRARSRKKVAKMLSIDTIRVTMNSSSLDLVRWKTKKQSTYSGRGGKHIRCDTSSDELSGLRTGRCAHHSSSTGAWDRSWVNVRLTTYSNPKKQTKNQKKKLNNHKLNLFSDIDVNLWLQTELQSLWNWIKRDLKQNFCLFLFFFQPAKSVLFREYKNGTWKRTFVQK